MEERPVLDNNVHVNDYMAYENVFALFWTMGFAERVKCSDKQVSNCFINVSSSPPKYNIGDGLV